MSKRKSENDNQGDSKAKINSPEPKVELPFDWGDLKFILENMAEAVLFSEVPTGKIIHINDAACQLLGIPERQMLKLAFQDIIDNTSWRKIKDFYDKSASQSDSSLTVNASIALDSGMRMDAQIRIRLQSYKGQTAAIIVIRGMAEQTLTQKPYDTILHISMDGFWIVNSRGNILAVNDAYCDLIGYTREELLQMNVVDIEAKNTHKETADHLEQIVNQGTLRFETLHQHKDGSILEIEVSAKYLDMEGGRIFSFFRDITAQKRIEAALVFSEHKYRELYENLYDGCVAVDMNGTILESNEAYQNMLGYDEEELYEFTYEDFTPKKWHKMEAEIIKNQVLTKGYSEVYEKEYIHSDGTIFPVELRAYLTRDSNGDPIGMWAFVRNIAERKETEESVRESEERYRTLVESAPIPILVHSGGKLVFLNHTAVEALGGSSLTDFLGKSIWDIIHEDYHQNARERIDAIQKEEHPDVKSVEKFTTLNGEEILVEAMCSKIIYGGNPSSQIVFHDITRKHKVEQELVEERERLNVTLRSIGEGVITTDVDGKIMLLNRQAEKLTGWNEKDAIGQQLADVFKIIDEQTRENADNLVEKVLINKLLVVLEDRVILLTKTGAERRISSKCTPIRDADFNIVGVILVFRDITETVRLQEFASRASRLEAAGRIAGQVAHDFNNLLAPLSTYPQLIKRETHPENRNYYYAEEIESAARHMMEINQQLITLGRRGYFSRESINLNDLVIEHLKRLPSLPEALDITTEFDAELMNISGGSAQIQRVIGNIIDNALESMSGAGELQIHTDNFYADLSFGTLFQVPLGEYVRLIIADTGTGIPEEDMAKIFDPFFTTKSTGRKQHAGLGLSVVHAVMEDHNGYVDCESRVGGGTSFYLYFPTIRKAIELPKTDKILGGQENILVVDDDELQQKVTCNIMEKLGYNVASINSGEDAVNMIMAEPYDLLILDMVMPEGMDGLETYQRALEINPSQKAIIVSGYSEGERIEMALKLGAGAFVRKPLTIKSLAQATRKALDREEAEVE
jgi:PAS domain S-box-containing protein